MIKYTKEELMKMPLKIVRGLDIKTIEEEKLIQEVVNAKTGFAQSTVKFDYRNVPDIKNAAQEKEWQTKIDEFNAKHTPVENKIAEAEKVLEQVKEEVKVEAPVEQIVTPTVITVQNGEIVKPFCDSCDSKARFHRKGCPKKI